MTDRDLQDFFDRHYRSGNIQDDSDRTDDPSFDASALPDDADPADVRAYRLLYDALATPPEDELPADFAERVANRVDLRPARAPSRRRDRAPARADGLSWAEMLGVATLLVAGVLSVLLFPTTWTGLQSAVDLTLQQFHSVADVLRLDVMGVAALSLLLALLADTLFARLAPTPPLRHRPQ